MSSASRKRDRDRLFTSAHAHCNCSYVNAATVQGRPLLRSARVLCGAYSRAAFIRGAAFIQGNTVLLNYQKAVMKAYVDAGLTKLGEITQHRSETLTSLVQCTKFQRTRNVLIQSMEAFYCFVLSLYIKSKFTSDQPLSTEGDIHSILRELLSDFSLYCMSLTHSAIQSGGDLQKVGCATVISTLTWKPSLKAKAQSRFWLQFVTVDILAYFVNAIRYRNWHLRNGSIRLVAAVFSAFDRPIYQILIPRPIFDILSLPESVLQHLQSGGFSVRLMPTEWHGVALDEFHEIKINKDAKMAVIRPSSHKMEHLSNHLSIRASCVTNFRQQLFPERAQHVTSFSVLLARIRNPLSMLNACWRPFLNTKCSKTKKKTMVSGTFSSQ